ncbi:MAG: hypothetical protein HYS13_22820 [Planctomycetia bacterium]|nr:hypothetical protein [Planctomycetia bacterium]
MRVFAMMHRGRTVRRVKAKTSSRARKKGRAVSAALLKLAGKARGLPRDAARNVDHHLYGHKQQ